MGSYKINIINDIEIEFKAKDLRDLLNTILESFNNMVIEGEGGKVIVNEIKMEFNLPDFFVDFFNEIIYLFESRGFVANKIDEIKFEDKWIYLKLCGFKFDKEKNKIKKNLKAATYHNLEFKKDSSLYLKIIIDI